MAPPPALALTLGEPAGIGPDITLAAWLMRQQRSLPAFFAVGDAAVLRQRATALGLDVPVVLTGAMQPAGVAGGDAWPNLFGAMRAGRIRVVSTAEGAGVRVGPSPLSADNGISVRSSGTLHVSGTADERARLRTEQGELALTAAGDLTLDTVEAKAGRIEFTAGNKLTLDAKTRESLQRDHEQWNNKFLFVTTETYNRERTTTDRQQQGTLLQAD
ncbi:MAG: hypothetical protein E2577_05355, partial [Starkeya sp.]|nr:hypothetical protein [Starkeya sp.]